MNHDVVVSLPCHSPSYCFLISVFADRETEEGAGSFETTSTRREQETGE